MIYLSISRDLCLLFHCTMNFINMTKVLKFVFPDVHNTHYRHFNCFFKLTCCFSTKFFTPSITNCDPVFITRENRLKKQNKDDV